MGRKTTSKRTLAGEPVADFMKRPAGYSGCWVCPTPGDTYRFQGTLQSSAIRANRKIHTYSYVGAFSNGGEYIPQCTVVCTLIK